MINCWLIAHVKAGCMEPRSITATTQTTATGPLYQMEAAEHLCISETYSDDVRQLTTVSTVSLKASLSCYMLW